MDWYNVVRYHLVPPTFLIFFTVVTQWLVAAGNPAKTFSVSSLLNLGSPFSWGLVLSFLAWSLLSLLIPSKQFRGPVTPVGYVPVYSANGTQYYLFSLAAYLALVWCRPSLPLDIHAHFDDIISTLNIFSLLFCAYLLFKGGKLKIFVSQMRFNSTLFYFTFSAHHFPEVDEGLKSAPLPYQFYSGIELHPRLLGVDIKQLTNCRFGMLGWALLVLNFAIASIQRNGFNFGPLANAVLINLYLLKFFYWETGYFNTLDITLDRAGYYLCWGCLTWVQVFYTFSAYYLVSRPSLVTSAASGVILVLGLASLGLNYWADYQKEKFKVGWGL